MDPDPLICAVLRHEDRAWEHGDDPGAIAPFIAAANFHGVLPLLDAEFRCRGDAGGWPRDIQLACLSAALARQNFEQAQRPEITRVLAALAADGVRPLVLKGGALAHSHYPEPALRPRSDTDLLVPPDQKARAGLALQRLGYACAPGAAGEMVFSQSLWSRVDGHGRVHFIDLHWRLNNAHVLARALAYPELAARSVALPALGPTARALAPVDALLVACLHRAGHAFETVPVAGATRRASDRLIWLYDIHLLARSLDDDAFGAFAELAAERRVRALCRDALERARAGFGTAVAPAAWQALCAKGPAEPSADLLQAGSARRLAGELRAIDGWGDRLRWLGEMAFPDAGYMRWKYRDAGLAWLPLLYLRRACSAVARQARSRPRSR